MYVIIYLGYYPNISADQLKAVNDLYNLLQKSNLEINIDEENEFFKLLRFLRARKFNVAKSFDLLKNDVEWRQQSNRTNLRNENAVDVLGCPVESVAKYFPAWIQGNDKQLRPVSYRQFGKFEIWNVLKSTSLENLLRFHAWETEQALRLMYKNGTEKGYNIETFVVVVDAAGWKMKLATGNVYLQILVDYLANFQYCLGDAYTFIKGMASTDSDHYPERLGMLVVINAPSMLSVAWKIVKGFLDDVTKAKIKIFSSQKDWQKVLFQAIDRDQIPEMYGGTAPNPDLEAAINLMNPEESETTNEEEQLDSSFVDNEDVDVELKGKASDNDEALESTTEELSTVDIATTES